MTRESLCFPSREVGHRVGSGRLVGSKKTFRIEYTLKCEGKRGKNTNPKPHVGCPKPQKGGSYVLPIISQNTADFSHSNVFGLWVNEDLRFGPALPCLFARAIINPLVSIRAAPLPECYARWHCLEIPWGCNWYFQPFEIRTNGAIWRNRIDRTL